ncbi:MAG: hypothetical protein LUF77_01965, partial [Oscillospiraceae bacterium]|nr:hypothetical protein [Oscillospiraceae bacterium]
LCISDDSLEQRRPAETFRHSFAAKAQNTQSITRKGYVCVFAPCSDEAFLRDPRLSPDAVLALLICDAVQQCL